MTYVTNDVTIFDVVQVVQRVIKPRLSFISKRGSMPLLLGFLIICDLTEVWWRLYIHDACHTTILVRCRDDIALRFMSCRSEIASSLVEPQSCSECKLECINHVTKYER